MDAGFGDGVRLVEVIQLSEREVAAEGMSMYIGSPMNTLLGLFLMVWIFATTAIIRHVFGLNISSLGRVRQTWMMLSKKGGWRRGSP